jgi:hypothetical protein
MMNILLRSVIIFKWVTIVYISDFFACDPRFRTPSIEAEYVHLEHKLVPRHFRIQLGIYSKDMTDF